MALFRRTDCSAPFAWGQAVERVASPPHSSNVLSNKRWGVKRMAVAEQSAQDLNSGTKPVDPRHAIDEAKLATWLEANVEGYAGPAGGAPVQGRPVQPDLPAGHAGQEVRPAPQAAGQAAAQRPRRRPRVQGDLGPEQGELPRRQGLRPVHGRGRDRHDLLRDGQCRRPDPVGRDLPDYAPAERRAIYQAEIATLAALHNVDYAAVGLADYGKPATTSPARSTAGPSSTRRPKPRRSRTWTG
jgi:hypothetical protein